MLRVKNIHYIMASLHVATAGNANLRIGEARIPRGLTVQLKITLHDNMGNEILHNWDAAEHLGYAVARRDGVNVQIDADFKLTVSTKRSEKVSLFRRAELSISGCGISCKLRQGVYMHVPSLRLCLSSDSPNQTTNLIGLFPCSSTPTTL